METRFLVGAVILAIGLALSVFGYGYGTSTKSQSDIKTSQTCEVNQELFTLQSPQSISDGVLEFDGKEIYVCDDGKRYTWPEFWNKYKKLKAGKGENLGGRG